MSNSIVFKSVFEQDIKNKCSSYIDQQAQLNSIMQNTQTKPKNMKKLKALISTKLRKFLNQTPDEFKVKKSKKNSKNGEIQLVKFEYKSNFVALDTTELPRDNQMSRLRRNTVQMTPIHGNSRSRRYSNGCSSSSSTSSLGSCNSDEMFLVNSGTDIFDSNLFLVQEKSSLNMTENLVESSTPVTKNRIMNRYRYDDETDPVPFYSYEHDYSTQEEEEENNEACYLDESTQCQESPVLTESTFNNSSLSNLSDDLIILQTTCAPMRPKSSAKPNQFDDNLKIINKYHENTNASFESLPRWALGNNLNLALVNQLYYNPSGNGIFNPNN
ncbi:unnamed protein product [Brachionus calyciflorus]|uniref:Uncharacterized protein n=1 Tax=Brachionus calyciflorus TaxID=104777 RepID=A0A813SMY3_9BILA|nr:unnamed protein product [Brachionus calyciflorus]